MAQQQLNYIQGDQFVGFNVNPTTGDLVLRYVFVVADKPDANGRGVTRRVLESNRNTVKGRPLIFAPNESQGGTRGHTDFRTTDPYKFEFARILNIEPSTTNLFQRWKNKLVQTNSSYNDLLKTEQNLWVMDVIVTNDQAKKILLDPVTSHLIPRYVSPSFIHRRKPNGDYSKVDDAIIDHVAIVNKPTFNNFGQQIDGAAYGEDTRLRGACFGDKVACLNLLQTSSSSSTNVVELDQCVSCPVQLRDRLTQLYIDLKKYGYIVQSSSSSDNMSQSGTTSTTTTTTDNTNPPTGTAATVTVPPANNNNNNAANPLNQFFKSDDSVQQKYNEFKDLFAQVFKENKDYFKGILIDSEQQKQQLENPNQQDNTNTNNNANKVADNLNTVENQQKESGINKEELLKQLDIKEEDLRNMKTEDLQKKIGDWKKMMSDVIERQTRTDRVIEALKAKEEKLRISNILPKEAFTDERGFNNKEFDDMVSYIHKKGLDDQYIQIIGVGLIALRNEQTKLNQTRKDLKQNKIPTGFGDSLKNNQQNQNTEQQEGNKSQPAATAVTPTLLA